MISTATLDTLPDIATLRQRLQILAVLDAILSPEWQDRYYSFNTHWSDNEQMGSMRNGCGDEFFALFTPEGCFLKGFAQEYVAAFYYPGMLNAVHQVFAHAVNEPAFSIGHTTFCLWRRVGDRQWSNAVTSRSSDIEDGSAFLLAHLDGKPETYQAFVQDYYEVAVPLEAVQHVYEQLPLTEAVVRSLNSDLSLTALSSELLEIGYPLRIASER